MVAFAIDYAITAAAPTLAWLFVGRIIAGATGAIYGPAGAVIADVSPPEKRAATFGLLGAAFGIGFIIGPALGGLVATLGPRAPFLAAALLAGLKDRKSHVSGKSVYVRVEHEDRAIITTKTIKYKQK